MNDQTVLFKGTEVVICNRDNKYGYPQTVLRGTVCANYSKSEIKTLRIFIELTFSNRLTPIILVDYVDITINPSRYELTSGILETEVSPTREGRRYLYTGLACLILVIIMGIVGSNVSRQWLSGQQTGASQTSKLSY